MYVVPALRFSRIRLKQRRLQAGLTETQFAAPLRISDAAVRHYERGRRLPSVSRVAEMASVLGCEFTDLLEADDPVRRP